MFQAPKVLTFGMEHVGALKKKEGAEKSLLLQKMGAGEKKSPSPMKMAA